MKKLFNLILLSFFLVLFLSFNFEVNAEMRATKDDQYTYYEDLNLNQITLGGLHSSALTSEGRLFTWGFNNDGQLGDGTTISKSKLVEITDQFNLNTGETIIKVSLGYRHSSVITSEGRLFTWGSNLYRQLGDGTIASKSTPTDITGQFGLTTGETIMQVSLGKYHSLAITSEGRLFTWGLNSTGQLGDGGSSGLTSNPTDITSQFGLSTGEIFTYVSLGDYNSSAITSEGKMFAWGQNSSGQLGDGTEFSKSVPTDITSQFSLNSGEKIIKSSYGYRHSFAITTEGRLFAWGQNSYGQLGDGTTISKSNPTEITSQFVLTVGESIIDFSSSYDFSSAITSEGRLFTWGENGYGQLGNGTQTSYTPNPNPIEITNQFNLTTEENIIQLSLGDTHSSIITTKGRLFSWGYNDYGQLGDGTDMPKANPIEIGYNILNISQNNLPIYEDVIQVSLGNEFSSAITSSGSLFTWGENSYGQLGDGSTTSKSYPTEITSQFGLFPGETITQISLGDSFSMAITSEDRLFGWGYNGFGQLGDGTTISKSTPTEITSQFNLSPGETITQVSLGQYHSLAITSEGRLFSWGANTNGQLGDDTTTSKSTPTDITGKFGLFPGETITKISSGESHSSAITSESRLFTWGYNLYGQLGEGTRTSSSTPTEITSQFGLNPGEMLNQIFLGGSHSLAITSSGRIFTWGYNGAGQLGDGTTVVYRSTPYEITTQFGLNIGETITHISLGKLHSSAITSENRVFTWGHNAYGQLGDGTTTSISSVTEITSQFDLIIGETIVQLALGSSHSSAISSEGRLFTWGYNFCGQLGDSTTTSKSSPKEINKLYSFHNEILLTYVNEKENYLKQNIKLSLFPENEINIEILKINVNGVDYSNIEQENGRIDVYIPNTGNLGDTLTFNIDSITFINDKVMSLSGDLTASTTLVEDTISPVISYDYDYDLYIEEDIGDDSYIQVTTTDDSGGKVEIEVTGEVDWKTPGEYNLSYKATDLSGNITSRTRTVIVLPKITTDSANYYNMSFYYFGEETYSSETDLENQAIRYNNQNHNSITDNSGYDYQLFDNDIIYEFIIEDRYIIVSKSVYYPDIVSPTFDVIEDQTVELNEYEDIDWTTYMDNVEDNSNLDITLLEVEDLVDYSTLGIYTVTVKAIDSSGNETLQTFNVTIQDTTPPLATLKPSLDSIEVGEDYIEYGVNAEDETETTVVITGDVNTTNPGVYELVYTVTDTSGNETIIKRYVTVYDSKPLIEFRLGEAKTTIQINEEYSDGDCYIIINGNEYKCDIKENTIDITKPGIYRITYSYTFEGKEYTYTRYIFVIDGDTPLELYIPAKKEEGVLQ